MLVNNQFSGLQVYMAAGYVFKQLLIQMKSINKDICMVDLIVDKRNFIYSFPVLFTVKDASYEAHSSTRHSAAYPSFLFLLAIAREHLC